MGSGVGVASRAGSAGVGSGVDSGAGASDPAGGASLS